MLVPARPSSTSLCQEAEAAEAEEAAGESAGALAWAREMDGVMRLLLARLERSLQTLSEESSRGDSPAGGGVPAAGVGEVTGSAGGKRWEGTQNVRVGPRTTLAASVPLGLRENWLRVWEGKAREQDQERGAGVKERASKELERRRLDEKINNIEEQLEAATEALRVRGLEYEAERAKAARDAETFSHELADAAAREQHLQVVGLVQWFSSVYVVQCLVFRFWRVFFTALKTTFAEIRTLCHD